MSDNHIRGISTTLALLDKALCEFDRWANGHEIRSVLYQVENPLSLGRRRLIVGEVAAMKYMLEEMRETLNLELTVRSADRMITSSCSVLWASLLELESRHLRRYGELPPGLAEYLDPKIAPLNKGLRRIRTAAAGSQPP
ncbi:MAG: hypothetical protein RDU20_18630 [Desulfomonilaceae bacterium]|nr:hypothetical protein [Desulfomonilaceae bacterium]